VSSKDPRYLSKTLDLLHGLIADKRMLFSNDTFTNSVEEICSNSLARWTLNEDSVLQLRDILSLVPQFPTLGRPLGRLVEVLIRSTSDPFQDYQTSAANAAWCLGSSMLALSKIKGWNDELDPDQWFGYCLNHYNWSSKVLEGLVSLSHLSYVPSSQIARFLTTIS